MKDNSDEVFQIVGSIAKCSDENTVIIGTGIMLNRLLDDDIEKKYEYGVMPHYVDKELLPKYFTKDTLQKIKIIDVDNADVADVARQMLSCKNILSSSLHGIVFSHSLGIPVSWIRFSSTSLTPDDVKFYDYLSIYDLKKTDLCNLINSKQTYDKLSSFLAIDINKEFLEKKKDETLSCIVNTLNK